MKRIFEIICNIEPKLNYSENEIDFLIKDIDSIVTNQKSKQGIQKISKFLCDSNYLDLSARYAIYTHQEEILKVYPTFSSYIIDNGFVPISKFSDKLRGFFKNSFINFVKRNADVLDKMIDNTRDYLLSISGFDSLKSGYLLRRRNQVIELPQYLFMRNAIALFYSEGADDQDLLEEELLKLWEEPIVNKEKISKYIKILNKYYDTEAERDKKALETIKIFYTYISQFKFITATPILANAGCKNGPLISCFIQKLVNDSINGIGETVKNTMNLQKGNGGVGTAIHEMRAAGSIIESSGRVCDGVVKPTEIFEGVVHYVDQNKKRPGAHVLTLSITHPDIFDFIFLKDQFRPKGKKFMDLFYAVWVDELFFERVRENGYWYLMCPSSYPGLNKVYGDEFNKLYQKYVDAAKKQDLIIDRDQFIREHAINDGILDGKVLRIKARQLLTEIFKAQGNSGVPYIMNKTQVNKCSNFKEIIEGSNLCCEITLPFDEETTAICCLSSIKISEFYTPINMKVDEICTEDFEFHEKLFDWEGLMKVAKLLVCTLNRVIDVNKYPNELSKRGAQKYRPIGIGIQDLASLFFKMRVPYSSAVALEMSNRIEEIIYFATLEQSNELAKIHGPYPAWNTSKTADGLLQFDLYEDFDYSWLSKKLDWDGLRKNIKTYGLYNSTLKTNMPNASTSNICGSTVESREALYANIYSRKFSFGVYTVINNYLMKDLNVLGLNKPEIINKIMENDGNLNAIDEIPYALKEIYKTVYEIGMKAVIDQYAGAQRFICQSQSMNVYPKNQSIETIWATYDYAISKKLKTICYYYRGSSKTAATKNFEVVTVKPEVCTSCSG